MAGTEMVWRRFLRRGMCERGQVRGWVRVLLGFADNWDMCISIEALRPEGRWPAVRWRQRRRRVRRQWRRGGIGR